MTELDPVMTKRVRRPTFLKEWRKHRKLTLEVASQRAGMTAGNLSAMERGAQGYTQAGLEALARVYECEPGQTANRTNATDRREDKLVDGPDRGRDAQAIVDLLHEGADCLRYFRYRARVACSHELAYLIAAVLPDTLWPFVLCPPTSEFRR